MTKQRGSATAEYLIVAAFVVIVLIANDNVIKQLADAIRNAYASFNYALSVSWL
jgi:Flp pilus assembly pilin Flp